MPEQSCSCEIFPTTTDQNSTPVKHNTKTGSSSSLSSSCSVHERDAPRERITPKLGAKFCGRKASGSIIVPRDDPWIEIPPGGEVFDEDDARAMSPRRSTEDLERISNEARQQLSQHAKILHENLLEIFNRIEAVKEEHDKLDSNNKFLQKYIGDLMSTSKITSTGAGRRRK